MADGEKIGLTHTDKMNEIINALNVLTTHGDFFYRNASKIARLAPGTAGLFLKTMGAGADPVWSTVGGGGTYKLAPTYTVYQSGATYYAMDEDGNVHEESTAMLALQWAHDNLPSGGGVIRLKGEMEINEFVISKKNFVLIADHPAQSESDRPKFYRIKFDASSQSISKVYIYGVYAQEVLFYMRGYNIQDVVFELCRIHQTNSYHGVIYDGDQASASFAQEILFDQCQFTSGCNPSDATYGIVTFSNCIGMTDHHFNFPKINLNVQQRFLVVKGDARCEGIRFKSPRVAIETSCTGAKLFHLEARTTIQNCLFVQWIGGWAEVHGQWTILQVDDAGDNSMVLIYLQEGTHLSESADASEPHTLFVINHDYWTYGYSSFIFKNNHIGISGNWSFGTITPATTFKVRIRDNAGYLTENFLENQTVNIAQTTIAHGLSIAPNRIDILLREDGRVWRDPAKDPDATNIYLKADADGTVCDIYVSKEFV